MNVERVRVGMKGKDEGNVKEGREGG